MLHVSLGVGTLRKTRGAVLHFFQKVSQRQLFHYYIQASQAVFQLMFQEIMSLGDNNYCKNTLSVNTAASGSLMSVRFAYARALETSPEIKYQ